MRHAALISVAVVVLVGCGKKDTPEAYSPEELCHTMAKNQCYFLYECCNYTEQPLMRPQWSPVLTHGTNEQCVEEYTTFYCPLFLPMADAVREQRAGWNEAEAERCFGFIEDAARECSTQLYYFGFDDRDCLPWTVLITGRVGQGDACFFDAECADPAAVCIRNTNPDNPLFTAEGTCDGPPTDGQECLAGGTCSGGHFCDNSVTPPLCRVQRVDGAPCSDANECQSGICGVAATCDPKRANGQPCVINAECQSGFCDAAVPVMCADRRQNGEPCIFADQCESRICGPDQTCSDPQAADTTIYEICKG